MALFDNLDVKITDNQLNRFGKYIAGIAGEPCEVERVGDAIYLFGSELATLRVLLAYRDCKDARVGYSVNLETFYFSLELKYGV